MTSEIPLSPLITERILRPDLVEYPTPEISLAILIALRIWF